MVYKFLYSVCSVFNILFTQVHAAKYLPILKFIFKSALYVYNVCIKCKHVIAYHRDHVRHYTRHKTFTFNTTFVHHEHRTTKVNYDKSKNTVCILRAASNLCFKIISKTFSKLVMSEILVRSHTWNIIIIKWVSLSSIEEVRIGKNNR